MATESWCSFKSLSDRNVHEPARGARVRLVARECIFTKHLWAANSHPVATARRVKLGYIGDKQGIKYLIYPVIRNSTPGGGRPPNRFNAFS